MSDRHTGKRKQNKKTVTILTASALAAVLGVVGVFQGMQPVEVYAKESFMGTKQIVTSHTDESNPFLILDIVPSYATYAWQTTVSSDTTTEGSTATGGSSGEESVGTDASGEGGVTGETTTTVDLEFSTGTLSYLVKGQSVMEKEYAEVYQKYAPQLKKYADRKAFVDAVWKSETDANEWGFRYEEAYAGTRKDLESADSISEKGWIELIKKQELDTADKNEGKTAHSGQMKGYYLKYESAEGSLIGATEGEEGALGETTADKTGYDYIKVGEWETDTFENLKDAVYTFDPESGTYRLTFIPVDASGASSENPISGYLLESAKTITSSNASDYSDATGVYIYDEASRTYYYRGTLGKYRNEIQGQEGNSSDSSDSDQNTTENDQSDQKNEKGETADIDGENKTDNGDQTNHNSTDNGSQTDDNIPTGTDNDSRIGDNTATGTDNNSRNTDSADKSVLGAYRSQISMAAAIGRLPDTGANNSSTGSTGNDSSNDNSNSTGSTGSGSSTDNNGSTGNAESGSSTGDNGSTGNTGNGSSTDNNGSTGNTGTDSSTDNNSTGSTGNGSSNDNSNSAGSTGSGSSTDSNGSTGSTGTDSTNNNGSSTGTGSTYYIVTFKYYEEITDSGQKVYAIGSAEQIKEDEDAKPYDAYTLKAAGTAGANGEDGADNNEYGIAPMTLDEGVITTGTDENDLKAIFLYVGEGQGDYKLIDESEVSEEYKGKVPPVSMEVRNAPTYFRYTGGCDWLKEYVFHSLKDGDNANENFKLEVKTIRADELTMEQLEEADLVYLESGDAPFLNIVPEEEGKSPQLKLDYLDKNTEIKTVQQDGKSVDKGITQGNIWTLVLRTTNELLPVVADYSIVTNEHYTDSNYQKMAKILLKKDLDAYVRASDTMVSSWLLEHLSDGAYPDVTDNGSHFVNKNVYVVNGNTPLVDGDFIEDFTDDEAKAGFDEVLELIRSENELADEADRMPEKVSKARALEYIINYSVGLIADFVDLQILELQPTGNDKADLSGENEASGGTVLYWKSSETGALKKQVLSSTKKMDVDVTVKSVTSFNSEWADINQDYNLVFIGLDGQKLNHSEDRSQATVYNDKDLSGRLYHSGDLAAGLEERYDPVDLTQQKKQELLDFMRAGFPILLENDFFKGKTAANVDKTDINTGYVAEGTVMYEFLCEAIQKFPHNIYTIDDVHHNVRFRSQLSTDHPRISLVSDGGSASDFVHMENSAEAGYTGSVSYQVTNRSGDAYGDGYSVEFYLDMNDDGVYTQGERYDRITDENGQLTVSFAENPGARIVPYRIRVSDSANTYRRSSVEGFLEFKGESVEVVKILQIGTRDSATSLASLYHQKDSVLGYYLEASESIMNLKFAIETMSCDALSEKLAANGDYLNQWDVVIAGFGEGSDKLPAEAVQSYVKDGRSLLVLTGAARSECLDMDKGMLGLTAGKTYYRLGVDSQGGYYRYRDLESGMFDKKAGLSVAGINKGSVFWYPYNVGMSQSFGTDTVLEPGDYRLSPDQAQENLTQVTPWYVLSGAGSRDKVYQVSPNDGLNNYYLYSKGNVVYIGHQDYSQYTYNVEEGEIPLGTGLTESKIFVNALILAYDAGIHNVKVDIVSGFEQNAAVVDSINLPFDQELVNGGESGLLDQTTDVYFKFKNSNLAVSQEYRANFYYEDPTGSMELKVGDETILATPFTSELWTTVDHTLTQVSSAQLKQGSIYRLQAPVIALEKNAAVTNARIFVEVCSDLQRPDGTKTVRGIDSVSLNRVQLFMLE